MSLRDVRNYLANPSWDDGTLEGWETYNGTGNYSVTPSTYTRAGRWGYLAGNYSLKIELGPGAAVSIGNLNFLPVNPTYDYYSGLYVIGGNAKILLMTKYYSPGFMHIETQYDEYTGPWSPWNMITTVSVPPPPAVYARFAFRAINSGTSTVTIWVDDAFMMPVNMPMRRAYHMWDNAYGPQDFIASKNIVRIYSMFGFPWTSSSTNTTSVWIEPAPNTPAGMIASVDVQPYPIVTQKVFSPPSYDGFRSYPQYTWKINSVRATGGRIYVTTYYNAASYWTTDDL